MNKSATRRKLGVLILLVALFDVVIGGGKWDCDCGALRQRQALAVHTQGR
jgi:hypothetical protein